MFLPINATRQYSARFLGTFFYFAAAPAIVARRGCRAFRGCGTGRASLHDGVRVSDLRCGPPDCRCRREHPSLLRGSSHIETGGHHGPRHSTVAAGRSDPDHHPSLPLLQVAAVTRHGPARSRPVSLLVPLPLNGVEVPSGAQKPGCSWRRARVADLQLSLPVACSSRSHALSPNFAPQSAQEPDVSTSRTGRGSTVLKTSRFSTSTPRRAAACQPARQDRPPSTGRLTPVM